MSRKRKGKAAEATVRGQKRKGQPTPKNTPGGMTRERHQRLLARRAANLLTSKRPATVDRALGALRGLGDEEQRALDLLMREAGGVILEQKEN